ncbi:hypothetical protein VKT23_017891 [Stygiomarasmius scandens]|uniref:HMG box domain-containing protein n=1 Tax=Marasmiellus scandens TaxID=2682957 RepID=A0ABR1IT74_9AGAR
MLRAARKQSTSTCCPYRHRTKCAAIKLTNTQKTEKKKARDDEKQQYQGRLKEIFAKIMDEAVALKEEFGKHDVQWYLDEIMQTYRLKQKKRKVAPFRAFVSQQMKLINSGVPEGECHKKISECIGDLGRKWAHMSEKERAEATTDAVKELEDNRLNKELASHNSSISAFHDVRTTMEDAKLMVPSATPLALVQRALLSRERVASFFELAFKQTPHAIGSCLEGYCISGVEGVARNYITETTKMKKELVKIIAKKLKVAGGKTLIPRMYYKNFDDHITAKYGVKIINWLLERFCCPSELSMCIDIQVLRTAWESGTTYFYKMTSAEWKEWDEKRFKDALEEQTSGSVPTNTITPTDEPAATPDPNPLELAAGQPLSCPTPIVEPSALSAPSAPPSIPPVPSQEKPKRGRKCKTLGDATGINFVNTTAVVGVNGDVLMQKPPRKRRRDADKPRAKKSGAASTSNNENEGSTQE